MTITKQHFKSLAEHLGRAFGKNTYKDIGSRDIIVKEIVDFCKEFNENFDTEKFENAVIEAEKKEAGVV